MKNMQDAEIARLIVHAKQTAELLADEARLTQSYEDFRQEAGAKIWESSQKPAEIIHPTKGWETWGAGLLAGVGAAVPFLMLGLMVSTVYFGFILLAMLLTILAFMVAVEHVKKLAKARFATRHDLRVKLFDDALTAAADRFRDRQHAARASVREKLELGSRGAMPSKQAFGVSHQGAERLCADWMKYLGASEVEVTQLTGDGGIDVVAASYIAQVKNYAGTVPINDVRALAGVVHTDGRKGLFSRQETTPRER